VKELPPCLFTADERAIATREGCSLYSKHDPTGAPVIWGVQDVNYFGRIVPAIDPCFLEIDLRTGVMRGQYGCPGVAEKLGRIFAAIRDHDVHPLPPTRTEAPSSRDSPAPRSIP